MLRPRQLSLYWITPLTVPSHESPLHAVEILDKISFVRRAGLFAHNVIGKSGVVSRQLIANLAPELLDGDRRLRMVAVPRSPADRAGFIANEL